MAARRFSLSSGRRPRAFPRLPVPAFLAALALLSPLPNPAQEVADARKQLLDGNYDAAIALARKALPNQSRDEHWHAVLIEGLHTRGLYREAERALTNALERVPRSILLRWVARDVFLHTSQPRRAADAVEEIPKLVSARPWSYREPVDLVVFGRALLAAGVDPKEVLDKVYATARRAAPNTRDVYLASGDVALDKHDFALAAKQFDEGLKRFPDDPDLHYGRARAFAEGDRREASASLEAALKRNPRHLPSLLLIADQSIDAEAYEDTDRALDKVKAVNPSLPEAWAYRAVLAHLRNQPPAEQDARTRALQPWPENPAVPHLIGRKLAQKYRFQEGAALQRQALLMDPDYVPAKAQLASDLLRLGENAEGWDLAQQVHQADAYDVAAFNLVTLRDTMASFATLTNEHFVVRMSATEAAIYGPRVLARLERARDTLASKYGLALTNAVTVEIFPEQKDFGVRTFGMPDNPGYLGVCFGKVITANSPASSRGRPVNWEAVLWHEFCHVVTLQLTANKMPRWLSEGISVYEERLADPAWGEQLTPKYREMILEDDLVPIARLSAAFLTPESPLHLQFAYYEASLVVEFLVERFGVDALKNVLRDLREGASINDALSQRTAAIEKLESDFAAFARARARALGPGLDWAKPANERLAPILEKLVSTDAATSTNYWVLKAETDRLVERGQWTNALPLLERLATLHPTDSGTDSAHALLAQAHRALGDSAAERRALERWIAVDAEATDGYLRLMELAAAAGDWPEVLRNVERQLAVNPLVPEPYRQQARAAENLKRPAQAIESYRTLLRLDPPNPPAIHYELARLLHAAGDPAARRHLLQTLEDAPRHRAALHLLLELDGPPSAPR